MVTLGRSIAPTRVNIMDFSRQAPITSRTSVSLRPVSTRPRITTTPRPTITPAPRPVIGSHLTRVVTGGVPSIAPTALGRTSPQRGTATTPTTAGGMLGGLSLGTFGGDISSIGGDLLAKGKSLLPVAIKLLLVFIGIKIVLYVLRGRR